VGPNPALSGRPRAHARSTTSTRGLQLAGPDPALHGAGSRARSARGSRLSLSYRACWIEHSDKRRARVGPRPALPPALDALTGGRGCGLCKNLRNCKRKLAVTRRLPRLEHEARLLCRCGPSRTVDPTRCRSASARSTRSTRSRPPAFHADCVTTAHLAGLYDPLHWLTVFDRIRWMRRAAST
jgi:hypothetical protein